MGEQAYRLTAAGLCGLMVLALVVFHPRQTRPAATRVADPFVELMRWLLLGGAAALLIAYIIDPTHWPDTRVRLPAWVRWLGAVCSLEAIVLVAWAMQAMGGSFAATVLVREDHQLIRTGPYRWVRHPMYALGVYMFVGLGLLTGGWLMAALGVAGFAVLMILRVPKEEALLATQFGERWTTYARQTGRFWPRFGADADLPRRGDPDNIC